MSRAPGWGSVHSVGQDDSQRRVIALTKQRDDLAAALRELIECKDLHDMIENRGNGITADQARDLGREYRKRRPLAWDVARATIAKVCPVLEPLDKVTATFTPERVDDLTGTAREMIGKRFVWQAVWIIEEGQHAGQWAMQPLRELGSMLLLVEECEDFGWAPLSDLADVVPSS